MTDIVVVTGASGRVGSLVAESLLAEGSAAVRVVARDAGRLESLGARGAEVRPGSFQDKAFLADVFRGARAAFVLTPVDISSPDVNSEQRGNVDGIAAAIRGSVVRNVVLLSSWGAEVPDKIGGVIACRWLEQLVDEIPDINVVHLRPVWFMENFLWNIPLIKGVGINGMSIKPDVPFPMISTRDIAAVASDCLKALDLRGRSVHYLNGARDYTMLEATRILGASIGNPDLKYAEFPDAVMRKGLVSGGGLTPDAADNGIEISRAIGSGRLRAEPRSARNTTPTTLETFAETVFAPKFHDTPDVPFRERLGGRLLRAYLSMMGHRPT